MIPDDLLALSIDGNKKDVTRRQWMGYAERCHVPSRAAQRILGEIAAAADDGAAMIARSMLPDDMKRAYRDLIRTRAAALMT